MKKLYIPYACLALLSMAVACNEMKNSTGKSASDVVKKEEKNTDIDGTLKEKEKSATPDDLKETKTAMQIEMKSSTVETESDKILMKTTDAEFKLMDTRIPAEEVIKFSKPKGAPIKMHGSVTTPMSATEGLAPAHHAYSDYSELGGVYHEAAAAGAEGTSGRTLLPDGSLAGKLTAGEVNDFKKWKMWEDIADGELERYRSVWRINPRDRYTVQVLTEGGAPVVDCSVVLKEKSGAIIWKTRTDNTGKAELWGALSIDSSPARAHKIEVTNGSATFEISRPKTFDKGLNTLAIPVACNIPDAVDICFTVDATGSMGDEIAYLQAELVDVIRKVNDKHKGIVLNLGSVFYRDHGDTYVTRNYPFTTNIDRVNQFIAEQYADGGGDGPEAVDDALRASLFDMTWQTEARARIMFLILDAPPHNKMQHLQTILNCTSEAAAKGVRIVPLVASGGGYDVDKSLEYLMRCLALATNGTYAFLTNHSGIGGHHTEPSTDTYDVETLNSLLLRLIDEYLMVPDCNLQHFVETQLPQDTVSVTTLTEPLQTDSLQAIADSNSFVSEPTEILVLKCYPNPATDQIWVQTSDAVMEIFLADNSGKLLQKLQPSSSLFSIDLTNYPSGIYYLKACLNEKWLSARIVVARLH